MSAQDTIDRLGDLKLYGMAEKYRALQAVPIHLRPTLDEFMSGLVEAERLHRAERRTNGLIKASKMRYNAHIEDIKCTADRNLTKDSLYKLAECGFITMAQNVLIHGRTGSGKSYLACAVGRQACILGHSVRYIAMNKFIEQLGIAKAEGTMARLLSRLEKVDLIILDDFGLQPMDANSRIALLQLLEDRYDRKSIMVTSQLPVEKWYSYINEATLADAIMDRLTAGASIIDLKGESMRGKNKK